MPDKVNIRPQVWYGVTGFRYRPDKGLVQSIPEYSIDNSDTGSEKAYDSAQNGSLWYFFVKIKRKS